MFKQGYIDLDDASIALNGVPNITRKKNFPTDLGFVFDSINKDLRAIGVNAKEKHTLLNQPSTLNYRVLSVHPYQK